MYHLTIPTIMVMMSMVIIPLAVLLRVAYKDTRPTYRGATPMQYRNIRLRTEKPFDWASTVEAMDYDVVMFDCPADPNYINPGIGRVINDYSQYVTPMNSIGEFSIVAMEDIVDLCMQDPSITTHQAAHWLTMGDMLVVGTNGTEWKD